MPKNVNSCLSVLGFELALYPVPELVLTGLDPVVNVLSELVAAVKDPVCAVLMLVAVFTLRLPTG